MNVLNNNLAIMDEYLYEHIEEFLLRKEKHSLNTRVTYENHLKNVFRDIYGYDDLKYIKKQDIENLTIKQLINYFDKLYKNNDYSNSTINGRMTALKQLIKYLCAIEVINYNLLKLDELLEPLKDESEEIERIPMEIAEKFLDYFKNHEKENGFEKYMIAKLAIETGLRAKEILELRWSQFQIEGDTVIIKSNGKQKGKRNKDYVDKISINIYNELLQLKKDEEDKIFTISYRTLARAMERANKYLNTDRNYTFHSFKKRAVTNTYLLTGSVQEAMKKGRHENPNTTFRYLEDVDFGMTGVYSVGENIDLELYKKVSHEELLEALSKMNKDFLYILNIKLMEKNK